MIQRYADQADTRAKRVRVTARGAELAPRAIAAVEQADRAFFEPVPTESALVMLRLLDGSP